MHAGLHLEGSSKERIYIFSNMKRYELNMLHMQGVFAEEWNYQQKEKLT